MLFVLLAILTILSSCKSEDRSKPSPQELAKLGKQLYRNFGCTDCHFITERELVGPGLKGVTKRRSKEWIIAMIVNPDSMFLYDSLAKELFNIYERKYSGLHMGNRGITREQAEAIYEFLRTLE